MTDDLGVSPMQDALAGVRVLDFSAVMAGPYATRMLADLGADVIKVESMEGDQVRARPPLREGHSTYFGHLNAGKRSIALNLKSPDAVALIEGMVPRFDVVMENFRPGVMKRLGLDYAALSKINPRLIYCSISGYGQTGPRALDPAYAPVVHASSGFDMVNMDYQDGAADRPANSGIFIADVLGGTHAFGAIQAALYQREKTGRGQFIDLSMMEAMTGMLVFETQQAQFPAPRRPIYTPLKTSDGFIMVAPTSPRNFEQLADAVGHPEWRDDPRFRTNADRNANWATLLALAEEWTIERPALEAERILSQHGVPCARYREVAELLDDPQMAARGAFATISDAAGEYRVTNPPFRMSASRTEARDLVAGLGEHGGEVLAAELGLDEPAITALRASGALG
ncbi:CoA transferase [Sphingomonas naphthae]|uniref:CoA transferase n=1 Tax=Sphingomonas naphthae TaxID=1813468 RepID=A0ABY7TKN0_9SPHN|nr:CoA transferase [Sphingomonas naphthae]WCT73777.1 CoA transferase [Sphingomonas naphthae]